MNTYEAPAALELGSVEELTFGGNLVPTRIDGTTGWSGFIRPWPSDAQDED